ncbi:MAG: hypothetical protein WD512_11955 [Candidatus Paceibacterota bacterium]
MERFVNWVIHYFFEPVVVPVLLNSIFPNMSLVTRLFSQDSIYNSSRYLLFRLNLPTEPSKISSHAKYLLYLAMVGIYYSIDVLTWFNFPKIYIYYLFTFITSPVILDGFLTQQFWILEMLEKTQKKILNYLTSVCLANSLNHFCIRSLNSNPLISANELDDVMTMQNMSYIWTFLKILLITSLIKYLESSKYVYGKILQVLYDRGNLIQIPQYQRSMILDSQIQNPKETLSKIVARRKWHYFYDPSVLNLVIKVYQQQEGSFLQDVLARFRTRVLQFFTLWTLHGFIPIPFLAFLFRLKDQYPQNLIIPLIDAALLIGCSIGSNYVPPNYPVFIAFFSEFCTYLDNGVTRHMINIIRIKVPDLLYMLTYQNKYNMYLLMSVPVVNLMSQMENPYMMGFLPIVAKYNFIYLYMLSFGYWSNYNFMHLSVLAGILYVVTNLFNFRHVPGQSVNMKVISSYWSDSDEKK